MIPWTNLDLEYNGSIKGKGSAQYDSLTAMSVTRDSESLALDDLLESAEKLGADYVVSVKFESAGPGKWTASGEAVKRRHRRGR
jgi:uncharacterized protein YbjQ (UPF0145 family)